MTEEGEGRLVQRVMEDSMNTYDEREWVGLEEMLALSAADDVTIPKEQPVAVKEEVHEEQPVVAFPLELVGQRWTWSCDHEDGPGSGGRALVPHAIAVTGARVIAARGGGAGAASAANLQGPPAHLWTMPPYIDLTGEDDDNGGA
uniref:Uncharacterized protein n=1 Tax=Hordeum vulgare subsp. vulgare TaxID=112509 RepID=A0A8I6XRK2_HORVV